MKQYHDMLRHILSDGFQKSDRTGTGTISVFGYQARFNLQEGFPLLTTKKMFWKGIVEELLWFIRGETNARPLQEKGVKIWDAWADKDGHLGPVYGHQWRKSGGVYTQKGTGNWVQYKRVVTDNSDLTRPKTETLLWGRDQLKEVVERIRHKPDCRRLIVSAWNPLEVEEQGLPPCHVMFQFNVTNGRLSCHMYQRSADVFLGVPFNIASYALLTIMIAKITGLEPGWFVHSFGDLHLYLNHQEQARLQLTRVPRALPRVGLAVPNEYMPKELDDFKTLESKHFQLIGYDPYPAIAGEVSV